MLLVVFGAGSSFDSVPHIPAPGPPSEGLPYWERRPPLANQLFDNRPIFVELMEKFKDCQPLVPMLRHSGASVEKKLAEFQYQAKTFPPLNRALTAIHFYLHFALWECQSQWHQSHRGITNFKTLLYEIERWRFEKQEKVCFVTFNYDTMLEDAMSQVLRLEVQDMSSYITWDNYWLFKLHGSINWGRRLLNIVQDKSKNLDHLYQHVIDEVAPGSERITNDYKLCERDMRPEPIKIGALHHSSLMKGGALYPAISIPVEKKDEFSCPPGHVTTMEGLLPRVTKIITIGWRATEAEFLAKLKFARLQPYAGIRNAISLLVVTGTPQGAAETAQNLIEVGGTSADLFEQRIPVTTGFTGLINDLARLVVFLRS